MSHRNDVKRVHAIGIKDELLTIELADFESLEEGVYLECLTLLAESSVSLQKCIEKSKGGEKDDNGSKGQ